MLTRAAQLAGRLHREEEGTALTEFVISLPAFLVIFVAIFQFTMVQAAATEVHVRAAKRLWTAALPVQKNKMTTNHMLPALSATRSMPIINKRAQGGMITKTLDLGSKTLLMATNGHFGESYTLTLPYEQTGMANYNLPTGGVKRTVDDVASTKFTRSLVNDGLSSPSGGSGLGALSSIVGATGGRPAIAAGIRYGLVSGEADKSVSLPGGVSWQTNAMYDVIVSPYPHKSFVDHLQTVGMVRLTMEECKLYSTILGIEKSNRFNKSC